MGRKKRAMKLEPIKITNDSVIFRMRRLLENEDFGILRGLWLDSRTKILNSGKQHMRSEDWARLDGFDMAIFEVEKHASRKMAAEKYEAPTEEG